MTRALVAVGSNLGRRRNAIESGLRRLNELPQTRILATSLLRETAPRNCPAGSPPFVNGAVTLDTLLSPQDLLHGMQQIEESLGRKRSEPNAPRTLDLDLILFGDEIVDEPDLIVPHPRADQRSFVLEPAAEVAPDMVHPLLNRTVKELADTLP